MFPLAVGTAPLAAAQDEGQTDTVAIVAVHASSRSQRPDTRAHRVFSHAHSGTAPRLYRASDNLDHLSERNRVPETDLPEELPVAVNGVRVPLLPPHQPENVPVFHGAWSLQRLCQ